MPFVPSEFNVPAGMQTEHLTLRMLAPDVTQLDYDALMESRVRLRLWSDSSWPADDFTLAENQKDLEEHEREFHAREAFAYTVLRHDDSVCEGCVYVTPLVDRIRSRRRTVANRHLLLTSTQPRSVSGFVTLHSAAISMWSYWTPSLPGFNMTGHFPPYSSCRTAS